MGRPLLYPGLGQGGPPFHFRPKGRNEGAGFGPFFRPRVGQEGNSPAGHTRVEITATTQPNPLLEMSRVRLSQWSLVLFCWLRGGSNQPSTGLSSIPDTFFGNRLASFTSTLGLATLNNPGASCGTLLLTWHR
jgi:hypothetical protein